METATGIGTGISTTALFKGAELYGTNPVLNENPFRFRYHKTFLFVTDG
jgi:hypothetical protein